MRRLLITIASAFAFFAWNGMALAQPARSDLPICMHHGSKSDCHIHDRETYLGMTAAKPDRAQQPHAWAEFREQERLAKLGHGK